MHNKRIDRVVGKKEAKITQTHSCTQAHMNGRRRTAQALSISNSGGGSIVHFFGHFVVLPKIKCIFLLLLLLLLHCHLLIHRLSIIRGNRQTFFFALSPSLSLCVCLALLFCFFCCMVSKMYVICKYANKKALKCQPAANFEQQQQQQQCVVKKFGQISAYVHRSMLFSPAQSGPMCFLLLFWFGF